MISTIKKYLAPIGFFLIAAFAVLRYFIAPQKDGTSSPFKELKKEAEADVEETKKEIGEVPSKVYSDEDISTKFN